MGGASALLGGHRCGRVLAGRSRSAAARAGRARAGDYGVNAPMSTGGESFPDFRSRAFLLDHVERTMAFYHPRAIDPRGGFYHFFKDDGTVYDPHTRHLVSSTRFVFNYAMAFREFNRTDYLDAVKHGIKFLRNS